MQRPHREATWQAALACPVVLVVQDDTQLDFSGRAASGSIRGVGPLGGRYASTRGLVQHTALAVDARGGLPLGVLDQQWSVRHRVAAGETRRQRQGRATEADRWSQAAEAIAARHGDPGSTRVVHVGDRHSDLWRFMSHAEGLGHGFVCRAMHDRYVDAERTRRLWSALADRPVLKKMSVKVSAQRGRRGQGRREPREARVSVRSAPLQVPPPIDDARTADRPPLRLWAVHVHEDRPPADAANPSRLDWMLLTSEPAATAEQALKVIGYYRRRWLIEEWHRVLKEGCRLERAQFDHARDIQRLAAVQSVVAVRLLQTRELAEDPDHADDPQALRAVTPRAQRQVVALWTGIAPDDLTPRQFHLAVAKKGGFLARTRDGRPGWKTLQRGYRELQIAAETLTAANSKPRCG